MNHEWQGLLRLGEKPNTPVAETAPVIEREHFRPEIEFYIDEESDIDIFMMFLKHGKISISHELDYVLDIKNEEEAKREVSKFVHEFYEKNKDEINKKMTEAENEWQKVEYSFFSKIDQLFGSFPWPVAQGDEKYKATASIWRIWPRFIKDKGFTFPANPKFKRPNAKHVIAHEMLHFIEYEYLEKKYGLQPSESSDQDNSFWQFTENLNVLIEGEEMWAEFMDEDTSGINPECRIQYEKMKQIWDKDKNIDNLIKKIFNLN